MGYGKIYNTTWWGNALDTARTAGTEPDFFGSQIKLLTSEQDNLITNGDFATDSDWTKGTGWSISDGVASQSGGVGQLSQNTGVTLGVICKVSFTTTLSVGSIKIALGPSGPTTTFNTSGTHTFEGAFGGNSLIYILGSSSLFVGSIDNVSVQLVRCDLEDIEAKKCLADWIHVTALQDLNN